MKTISKIILLSILFYASHTFGVVTLGHVQNGSSAGQFRQDDGTLSSAGGVSIGFFTGSAPSDATLQGYSPSTAYASLLAAGWVDIRNVASTTDPTAGAWDYPGIGGTASNISTAGTYGLNKQLYIVAFNAGSYVVGTEGNISSTSSSFAGSTQWAIVKDATWTHTADPSGITLQLNAISNLAPGELIVGTKNVLDGANDIRMVAVPEPSRMARSLLAVFGLIARRRRA
jgi:hypothetical protein